MRKAIIFSAPSGAGKSTIVNYLLKKYPELEFSISATNRPPRGEEVNGKEYYFLSTEEFRSGIAEKKFLEYEEVYPGHYYGTLKDEVNRIWDKGNVVVFDIDVVGGLNIKRKLGYSAYSIFIQPPSVEVLRERLIRRATDAPDKIEERVDKAEYEMKFAVAYDTIVVNDDLERALGETERKMFSFLEK